ncbi:MAG: BON domain-containing protein [Chloroflexota bacterium]
MDSRPFGDFSAAHIGATPRDEELALRVFSAIKENGELRRHSLQVLACEGEVELRGEVPDSELRQTAGQMAISAPGVRNIINHIVIGGDRA